MEAYQIRNLSFAYPGARRPALSDISLTLAQGEFVVLCGKSGCGKTTLLRNLKTVLAPHGVLQGEIEFFGRPLSQVDLAEQTRRIGYVLQDPDNQLVTDKVWHELAFGLENLGMDTRTIRLRVAEMASFFGIQTWFDMNVNQLSGGQKQLLNLAAVMVMQPDVLVLDEPTSQLDPIAASEFLDTVRKVNRELGTTVLMTEHRLEEILPMAGRAVVLDEGRILVDDIPANAGAVLSRLGHPMFEGMPAPLQAYGLLYEKGYGRDLPCPLDVGEGRRWLSGLLGEGFLVFRNLPETPGETGPRERRPLIELRDVWYRYEKNSRDVLKGLSMNIYPGEIFCIVGGNGTGKTTALSILSGQRRPLRGILRRDGILQHARGQGNSGEQGAIGLLPQNAQTVFVGQTIREDLLDMLDRKMPEAEKERRISEAARLTEIEGLLDAHPFDVSGGEQQRAALAKILLLNPRLILLDEPTKGIDNHYKNTLAGILRNLTRQGATVVMVSHDIEFCSKAGDRCAMFFDGAVTTTNAPRAFFSGNSFYTTAANRMSRHLFGNAVTAGDVAELCLANLEDGPSGQGPETGRNAGPGAEAAGEGDKQIPPPRTKKALPPRIKKILPALVFLPVIPAIFAGLQIAGSGAYLPGTVALIFAVLAYFYLSFESRRPQAREVVLIAVLIALAVASRAAFFMTPQFKPMLAVILISGACLGPQTGFLVGSMSAFVSNFLFGQGPWTPFQMLAWGLMGWLAGLLAGRLSGQGGQGPKPVRLAVLGFFSVYLIHGGITDLWTLLGMSSSPTWEMAALVYGAGLIFNTILAAATMLFVLLFTRPMAGKLRRVREKYGLLVSPESAGAPAGLERSIP